MVVYLHESLDKRIASDRVLTESDIHEAAIEGAVQRLRPKLMTVSAVLASLIPILWASGIGCDVMKPIAAPKVGGMITNFRQAGFYHVWLSLAPDDSPLLLRDTGTQEIYALDWQVPY